MLANQIRLFFERQKQNTKFFRSEEIANVLARRFSLATNSFIEGSKNSSKNEKYH